MTLRLRPLSRSNLVSLLVFATLTGAAVLACSSNDNDGTSDPGGTSPDGGGTSPVTDGGEEGGFDEGPVTPIEFPAATPAVGGYTLADAFPNAEPLDIPSAIAFAKSDTANAHPFVLERTGQIRRLDDTGKWDYANPVVDFGQKVNVAGEGGAVGMVLHPKFGDGTGTHDFIYVWYNACQNSAGGPFGCGTYSQKLERYTYHAATRTADSPLLMIEEQEDQNIHNAGKMLFGPDGYLYFSNGDDGDEGELANHQNVSNAMFAGIFRIDVDVEASSPNSHVPLPHTRATGGLYFRDLTSYRIPNDNPWANVAGNVEEYFAMGFRNPYSWTIDPKTGVIWEGDVGDSFREEVNRIERGKNYQWPIMEGELTNAAPHGGPVGSVPFLAGTAPGVAPVFHYSHAEIADLSSIFGGPVYHGASLPELEGKYLYTDWPTNHVWALDLAASPVKRTLLISNQFKSQPMGWGQDNAGEAYLIQYGPSRADGDAIAGGHIKKLVRDTTLATTPRRLKGTVFFSDVPSLTPAADMIPYTVSSPLWSDGASKTRWIRVPAGQKITLNSAPGSVNDGTLKFPVGTAFIKQFDLPEDFQAKDRATRHLETRVLVVGTDTTYGYTFRWRPTGTDADLVADGQDETLVNAANPSDVRNWHYPSPAQCLGCHRNGYDTDGTGQQTLRNEKYRILGFTPAQLLGELQQDGTAIDLRAAARIFDDAALAKIAGTPVLPVPGKEGTVAGQALAYLASNCSPCHHENASFTGRDQTWIATFGAGTLAQRGLDLNAANYPMTVRLANDRNNQSLKNGKLIDVATPDNSVLLNRLLTNDPDLRMPPIARNVPDPTGAAVVRAWIAAGAPPN